MTRDNREGWAEIGGRRFRVLDTAGHQDGEGLEAQLRRQVCAAIAASDLCLLLLDARAGVNALDHGLAAQLRRTGLPVVPVANKVDARAARDGAGELAELGFGEAVEISAEHGIGIEELLAAVDPWLEAGAASARESAGRSAEEVGFAILGRPNVGKSTLTNAMLGHDRMVVGSQPGITRDAISVSFVRDGRPFRVVDTAGLRRKRMSGSAEEVVSAADALRALRFAEVAVLLVDSAAAFEQQDLRLADQIEREGRALVFAAGKWDLVRDAGTRGRRMRQDAERLLPALSGAALVPVSGLRAEGVDDLLAAVREARVVWSKRVGTGVLNRWLADAVWRHPPPAPGGRRIRLRYLSQINVRPPTFALFASRPAELDAAYRRYLVNGIRKTFRFPGTPIRLLVRTGENPYRKRAQGVPSARGR